MTFWLHLREMWPRQVLRLKDQASFSMCKLSTPNLFNQRNDICFLNAAINYMVYGDLPHNAGEGRDVRPQPETFFRYICQCSIEDGTQTPARNEAG